MTDTSTLKILVRDEKELGYYVILDPDIDIWQRAYPCPGSDVLYVDKVKVDYDLVVSFLVTYPSGEVADYDNCPEELKLPLDTFFMDGPVYKDNDVVYHRKLVVNTRSTIAHSRSRMGPYKDGYYKTSVTNNHSDDIRVIKFGAVSKGLFGWMNKQLDYYSPQQFREWYRVKDSEGWIKPNDSVCDPDNWSEGLCKWIYFFETRNGDVFISESVVNSDDYQ